MHYVKMSDNILKQVPFLAKIIFLLTFIISLYGVIILYSASTSFQQQFIYKQIITLAASILIFAIIIFIDIRIIYNLSYISYFVAIIMLLLVYITGTKAMGATRWLNLGIIKIQPSEFSKIAFIIAISKYMHGLEDITIIDIFKVTILFLLPFVLILKQPDLGTAIILLLIFISIVFSTGINIKYYIYVAMLFLISAPYIYSKLHAYQKERILTFLYPERDPFGSGYNIIQSKIAIGSGGIFGKGFFSGTQSHLKFLPEYHTDFIFSFLSEEFGFIGSFITITSYLLLIIAIYLSLFKVKTRFAKFIIVGIATMIFSHIFINIGMVTAILPVVGIPLPLISYGGTMLVSFWISIAIIVNILIHYKTKNLS
ncbi:MAG TPA: rod shape-determining protein RodA [Candidatus Megaira endosymbiont of Hartmannula sinica]|nr:rod shape-determining protein RodA [Candidatus Megaera endosymbiont of Hartmannula sinica]